MISSTPRIPLWSLRAGSILFRVTGKTQYAITLNRQGTPITAARAPAMHAPCALESNAKSGVSILALGYTTIFKKKDGSDGGIPARNIAGIKLPLNP
jgi:hypothetical protein